MVTPSVLVMVRSASCGISSAPIEGVTAERASLSMSTGTLAIGTPTVFSGLAGCRCRSVADTNGTAAVVYNATITADVHAALTLAGSLNARNTLGGTAPSQVRAQIERHQARLG